MARKESSTMPVFRCNATIGKENKIESCNCDIAHLRKEMKKEIGELKDQMKEQSHQIQALLNSQAKSNILITKFLENADTKFKFPINTLQQLEETERDIPSNRDTYINILKKILVPSGIKSGLKKVIGDKLVMDINYDGIQGKTAFKQFSLLNDVMYEVLFTEGYTKNDYVMDLRKSFQLTKNRMFKAASKKNKLDNTV